LSSRKHFARVISENGIAFVRGTEVDIRFDEEQFVGGGVYLFASVLEHFLGLYRFHEQLQPAHRQDRPAERGNEQMAAESGEAILL